MNEITTEERLRIVEEMDNPLEEIKDDAHWFIETYEREAWCEEVTRLGRQL